MSELELSEESNISEPDPNEEKQPGAQFEWKLSDEQYDNGLRSLRPRNRAQLSNQSVKDTQRSLNMNSQRAISKLYSKKTLGRFKRTHLETILEMAEETDANANLTVEPSKVFGKSKIKRCVSFSDGFNISKTLQEKRKKRIKKVFGIYRKLIKKRKNYLDKNEIHRLQEYLHADKSIQFIAPQPIINAA